MEYGGTEGRDGWDYVSFILAILCSRCWRCLPSLGGGALGTPGGPPEGEGRICPIAKSVACLTAVKNMGRLDYCDATGVAVGPPDPP